MLHLSFHTQHLSVSPDLQHFCSYQTLFLHSSDDDDDEEEEDDDDDDDSYQADLHHLLIEEYV